MSNFKKLSLLVLLSFIFITCSKNKSEPEPTSTSTSKTATVEYAEYSPFELVTVEATNFTFPMTNLSASIGDKQVECVPGEDGKSVLMLIPEDMPSGPTKVQIKSSDLSVSVSITIKSKQTYSGDAKTYLSNDFDNLISSLTQKANNEVNSSIKNALNNSVSKLNTAKSTISTLTDEQAHLLAQYFYVNERMFTELEENYSGIDHSFATSTALRVASDESLTAQRYIKCIRGLCLALRTFQFKRAGQITILTSLMGIADVGEGIFDLFVAGWQGKLIDKIASQVGVISEIVTAKWWVPVPAAAPTVNNLNQSLLYRIAAPAASISVKNNSSLTFNNFKMSYRNFQESDRSSSFGLLSDMTNAFITLKNVWNNTAATYLGFDPISFNPSETQNKTILNLASLEFTCNNSDIIINSAQGTVSSFSVKLESKDNTQKNGILQLKYTDALGQVCKTEYDITVVPVSSFSLTGEMRTDGGQVTEACYKHYYFYKLESLNLTVVPDGSNYKVGHISSAYSKWSNDTLTCTNPHSFSPNVFVSRVNCTEINEVTSSGNSFSLPLACGTITGTIDGSSISAIYSGQGCTFKYLYLERK